MNIEEKLKVYLEINKELVEFRKKQKEQKKVLINLEKEIHEYMLNNKMDSINIGGSKIILYDKKINQSFKRSAIIEKLTEKLDEKKAEELAESILTNKVFTIEKKLKVDLKNKKT
jgi:CO dehydrogenase/acetyl-CoA synthase gamma subunit (corrinoid Fe-S protein)